MVNRDLVVDTLRGFACILLVAYHVVGDTPDKGLRIDSGLYRDINDLLIYIRMPLFTFLSGMVYAYRPFSGATGHFIKGKLRRLILPMLILGTLFAVLQSYTASSNHAIEDWHLLHIIPVGHFWFIEALFIIFMLLIPLEKLRLFNSIPGFGVVLAVAVGLYVSDFSFPYFSITGAIYLFPYFLCGMALVRYGLMDRLGRKLGLMLMCIVAALITVDVLEMVFVDSTRTFFALGVGVLGCIGLLALRPQSRALAYVGQYSYTIYLYHVFFTAASRIVLDKFGVESVHMLFVSGLLMGLAGPIITERLFDGTNSSRVLMLGKSTTRTSKLWLTRRVRLQSASPS